MNSETTNTLTLTFPDTDNGKIFYEAVAAAVEDEEFMGDDKQVSKTAEVIIPKGTLSATFKRLEKNARRDYLDKLDSGVKGYEPGNRDAKIRSYVEERFNSYLLDLKTTARASRLFKKAFSEE